MNNSKRSAWLRAYLKEQRAALLAAGWRLESPRALLRRAREWYLARTLPDFPPYEDIPQLESFNADVARYKVNPAWFTSADALALHQRADYTGADPVLLEFTQKLFLQLRKRGFPVYVHTCWRSPELQLRLFNEGNSTLRSGAHQRSAAVDIVHAHYHWNATAAAWRYIGLVGEHIVRQNAYPIVWGGRWVSFPDPAHWELKGWRQLPVVSEHSIPLRGAPAALVRLQRHVMDYDELPVSHNIFASGWPHV